MFLAWSVARNSTRPLINATGELPPSEKAKVENYKGPVPTTSGASVLEGKEGSRTPNAPTTKKEKKKKKEKNSKLDDDHSSEGADASSMAQIEGLQRQTAELAQAARAAKGELEKETWRVQMAQARCSELAKKQVEAFACVQETGAKLRKVSGERQNPKLIKNFFGECHT